MFNEIFLILLSLIAGIVCAFNSINPLICFIFIFAAIVKKRIIINIALSVCFISGYILFASIPIYNMKSNNIRMTVKVDRTLKYGYIVKNKYNFLMNSNEGFFEGDEIDASFQIKELNPNSGFESYLIRSNIHHSIKPNEIFSVDKGKGIANLRTKIINRVRNLFNDDAGGFINSVLLGYRNDLNPALKEAFSSTGTAHFLAISGLHTGIVYLFLIFLLYVFPIPKNIKTVIVLATLVFYTFITYGNPPVVRAVIFILLAEIAYILKKPLKIENIIYIAAIIIIVIKPYSVFSLSFWLSFLCVYVIIKLITLLNTKIPILGYVLLSIMIPICTSPIILYFFNRYYILTSLLTLLLIPVFTVFLPVSIIAILTGNIFIVNVSSFIYRIIESIVFVGNRIPVQINIKPDLPFVIICLLYIIYALNRKYKETVFISISALMYSMIILISSI